VNSLRLFWCNMGTVESTFVENEEETTQRASQQQQQHPPPVPRKPLVVLTGNILGLPQTGKSLLKQTLRGDRNLDKIPFRMPPDASDRVALHLVDDWNAGFTVYLVDPRHDPDAIRHHLHTTLETIWKVRYRDVAHPPPFCLCILVNFRDQMHDNDKTLSQADVQQLTLECILLQDPPLEPSLLQLQCVESSLVNFYGLTVLHAFCYQSYLAHKLYKANLTVQRLLQAQRAAVVPTLDPYPQYVQQLRGPQTIVTTACDGVSVLTDESSRHKKKRKKKKKRRSVLQVPAVTKESALEAFLASDDEEKPKASKPVVKQQDDLSDEEEFFYQEPVAKPDDPSSTKVETEDDEDDVEETPLSNNMDKEGKEYQQPLVESQDKRKAKEKSEEKQDGDEVIEASDVSPPISEDPIKSKEGAHATVEGPSVVPKAAISSPAPEDAPESDSEAGLFIEDRSLENKAQVSDQIKATGSTVEMEASSSLEKEGTEKPTGGLSEAAREAILQAQRDAETMMIKAEKKQKKKEKKKDKKKKSEST